MAHVEVLVEELSAQAALSELLPKLLGAGHTWRIIVHQGKPDMLSKLPGRLSGYAKLTKADPSLRVAILVDRDRDDCHKLKRQLEAVAQRAGLVTRSANRQRFCAVTRIAIEELEAWFFGDVAALTSVYKDLPQSLGEKAVYRVPDAIRDTWEALEKLLQDYGHHPAGLPKISVAREIARHMSPARNRSESFRQFCEGLTALVSA